MNLDHLKPETRIAFMRIIYQFAVESGAAKDMGIEAAGEAILREIEAGRVKLYYEREFDILTLEVL